MAVVKSLKNAKHKRLWVKKFKTNNSNNSSFTVYKHKLKFKTKKSFDWIGHKKINRQLYNYCKTYNLVV